MQLVLGRNSASAFSALVSTSPSSLKWPSCCCSKVFCQSLRVESLSLSCQNLARSLSKSWLDEGVAVAVDKASSDTGAP